MAFALGDSLMVERMTLDHLVGVRIPVPQPGAPAILYSVVKEQKVSTGIEGWASTEAVSASTLAAFFF